MVEIAAEYEVLDVIYSSQYTTVYKVLLPQENRTVLIKSLNTEFNNPINSFKIKSKYDLLKKLENNCLVKVYEFFEFENRCSVMLEDFGGIPLSQYINRHRLELKEFLEIALKITKCIHYIHSNHVIHKSINPFNILYNSDEKKIKLFGFENSSEFSFESVEALNPRIFYDNLFYISPEQTGRMNRPIDYRTDFYSLGITLYELACSKLPFASLEAADMAYFHMAKNPLPAHQVNPNIPFPVSQIISKLMEKMPEDRYKSALGIESDIQECLHQLEEKGTIENFELGKNDQLDKFEIPKKLYGRDPELRILMNSFEKATKGNAEFVFVGGYSGIGKTALVNELHKPIMKEHGIFLSGKCDQYNKNIPYYALFTALNQFCTYILSDSEEEVKKWKESILDAIGKSGALLIDVIPKLELIIGEQPRVTEEFAAEMQMKFNLVLQNLLRAISSQKRPIVFFIDDLQWVDAASLELFENILFDNSITGLLFICTYRENEVDVTHPLIKSIKRVRKDKGRVELLHLENLNVCAVAEMIGNVLKCQGKEVYELAKIIHEKTLGNPFYIIEFLKYCNEENLLTYNVSEKRWIWKESDIKNSKTSDNVVTFLIEKMKTLPNATKELMLIAACVGNRFDRRILSAISGKSIKNINQALEPAIANEMIYILEKNGLRIQKVELLFCHDKFRQAAYFTLTEEQKKKIYLNIINYYEKIEGLRNSSEIFLVAELYTKVLDCINKEDTVKVINLFVYAAKIARLTSAFDAARQYLELVMDIVPEDLKREKSFMQSIYSEYHLVLFNLADFERMDKVYSIIENITEDPIELVNACCIQLMSLSKRNQHREAFLLGIDLLGKLGIHYPQNRLAEAIAKEVENYYSHVCNGGLERLEENEILCDEKDIAVAKLLNRITIVGSFFDSSCSHWASLTNANLMFEKGLTNWCLELLSSITAVLVAWKNDFYSGYKASKTAIALLEKKGFTKELHRTYHVYSILSCQWFEPLETSIYYAHKAFRGNLENGEFELSGYSFFTSQSAILECCKSIFEMQTEIEEASAFVKKTGNFYAQEAFAVFYQLVRALRGETLTYGSFNDEIFQEEKYLTDIEHNGMALAVYYIYRSLSAVLFSDFKSAYILVKKADPYLSYVTPYYIMALHSFLSSIAICKNLEETENAEERQSMQKTLKENQEWLCQRAKDAPFNFQHLYDLVQAEIKAAEGKYDEAFVLYEIAMAGAEKNKRPYHYAFICELIGQRYLKLGIKRTASYYIKEAYVSFLDWGAAGKAAYMKEIYKEMLFPNKNYHYLPTEYNTLDTIDLNAIIHVSQTIFSEMETKKLLEKLMEIMMQNSGSTKGHIFLKDENRFLLFVSGSVNNNLELIIDHQEITIGDTDSKKTLPVSMINYVARTKDVLIIDSIARSQFAYEPYFEKNNIQSAMCLPILQQNILKGIVYLENSILSGAFTKNNIDVLKVIASQAAISIENAFLYEELENKVKERTMQLEETISKLKETNVALEQEITQRITTEKALKESERQMNLSKEYDKIKTEFFSNISHELRTPINVIFSALQIHMYKQKDGHCQNNAKECYKYGYIMQQNCYRLLRLINNLIDITKIDSGYFNVNEVNVNMVNLIENITISVADYIEDKGISLIFDTEVEERIMACDPEKIERIILNLLSNAVKFTPAGGVIKVMIESKRNKLCIRVKDTGRGIPKEKLDVIFKRFIQVDKSFTRDHEGSGIGLSLVKDLVELHGGTISVKSRINRGSEFVILLPCRLVHQEQETPIYGEALSKGYIEKINIEFSDIYK
ncbi:AAA family ATPase [Clostridium aminobutyricum]|uniref:histidine kinase n=1 Tax=Clostridium aminobutyricum TaxID=33953 RepID=A0A939D683_CLOAM|nr:AAA family ATPase [Clostridium aminobutyricum]MBN7771781.1 AAA family ATPase [Clostridium aminobutyricum]